MKSECGHEMAVPGYSGLQQPPKPEKEAPAPRSDSPGPEACLSALSRLFTAMNQNRSLLLPRGKNNGLLTAQRAHCYMTSNSKSCFPAPVPLYDWGKKVLSRSQSLDLDFPVSKLPQTHFLSLKTRKEEA